MTAVGMTTAPAPGRVSLEMPSYSHPYPSIRVVRLAAVKEGLFHPKLPTFRRMDMDTASHKLPDHHCRTATACCKEEFQKASTTLFTPAEKPLSCTSITETGRQLHKAYGFPEELKHTSLHWSEFIQRCPEKYGIHLPKLPNAKDLHFSGYAVRHLRPEVTASWKYSLRQEPTVDQTGQRPMPANIFGRYRDTYPQYSRNVSTAAWR